MATKITVVFEKTVSTAARRPRPCGWPWKDTGYEINISTTTAAAFRQQLAPYIPHGRRLQSEGASHRQRPGRRTTAARARRTVRRAGLIAGPHQSLGGRWLRRPVNNARLREGPRPHMHDERILTCKDWGCVKSRQRTRKAGWAALID